MRGVTIGCLSDAQLARVRESAPGGAPAELAQHLADCARCQERALFGSDRTERPKREAPRMPSLRRSLLLLGLVVLAIAAFFWTLGQLAGRGVR